MGLPGELHVGLVLDGDRLDLDALGREQPAARDLVGEDRAGGAHVHAQEVLVDRLHEVVAHVGHQAPQGRGDPGTRRHQHPGDGQLAGQGGGVQRAGAAEREQDEVARVVPALQRHQADGAGHLVVGHAHDGGGDLLGTQAEMGADLLVEAVAHRGELRGALDAEESAGLSRPRSRLASVVVGSSPPRP